MNKQITIGALIDLTLDPVFRWIECRMLYGRSRKLDFHEKYYRGQIDNGTHGIKSVQIERMWINTRLRDLEK